MTMRIISGSARGRRLRNFTGQNVRPTSDRVREALFSMLASRLGSFQGLNVLDLFAGSGALGIEALSRGAGHACFVDQDRRSLQLIRDNLALCHFQEQATIASRNVASSFPSLLPLAPFDLVFLDPPYKFELGEKTLKILTQSEMMAEGSWLCAETDVGETMPESSDGFQRLHDKVYGRTRITLYCNSMEKPA